MEEQTLAPMQQRQLILLSTAMNSLRHKEVLTDVTLVCDGQNFPANKIVLAASTPFFAEMFEGNTSDKKCEELQKIPAEIMKILLEFVYTGNISVDVTDVSMLTTLVTFASDLQLSILVEHCLEILLQSLTCANILQFRKIIEKTDNAELKVLLMKHLSQNIFKTRDNVDLRDLSLDCFVEILSSKDISVESPDEVLRTVLAWVTTDLEQRMTEIKYLLPLIDKKGLSDDVLFEMQQTDLVRKCPELIMFALEVMTARYRSLSSLRGSSCSLYSENSESNDTGKDETAEQTNDGFASFSGKPSDKTKEITVALGKNGEQLPTIKEEFSSGFKKNLENPSIQNQSLSTNEVKRDREFSMNQTLPVSYASSPPTQKVFPISTSPPVKDTSPSSTPALGNEGNRVNGSEVRRALQETPLLLTPYEAPNQCRLTRSPAPREVINKSDGAKPKELHTKPQRTVADLSFLTVGKKQVKTGPPQLNTATRSQVNSSNLSKGATTERIQGVDSDRNQNDSNRNHNVDRNSCTDDVRNSCTDELFSRCNEVIRNHEANRKHAPNRYCERVDRNSHDASYTRKPFRNHESAFHQPNHGREPKCSDIPLAPNPKDKTGSLPAASKSRVSVSVKTSQQMESSKDVFFILENSHEWCIESFSTETDEWAKPKPMSKPIYHRATVVSVGHVIYIMGGTTDTWGVVKTVFMYNILTDEWRIVADMQDARYGAGGAQLHAYIYIVGGIGDVNTRLNQVERYSPLADSWSSVAPLPTCREQPSVASVDNRLYVIGGYVVLPQQWQMRTIETKPTATGEVYDPKVNQWTELDTPLVIGREVADKTFCTTGLADSLYAIRMRTSSLDSSNADPVMFEYSLQAKKWRRHTISDPELTNVVHICSMNNDEVCLVSGKGNVYIFQLTNGIPDLQKCSDDEKKGLVYAAMPGVSK